MFLMTPHGESMCALIDFMPTIPSISIKACNGKIFNHSKAFFDWKNIDLF